jgi:hypothetical protein
MSEFNGKKVFMATLHEPTFIEGAGQIEATINTTSAGCKVKSMTVDEPFVVLDLQDKAKRPFKALIPIIAFKALVPVKE